MKILISGILFCLSLTLAAAELNKYSIPSNIRQSQQKNPYKTRGIIPNPAFRSLMTKSAKSFSKQELSNINKTINILSKIEDKKELKKWLKIYQNKADQAKTVGKLKEARYYKTIIQIWQRKERKGSKNL